MEVNEKVKAKVPEVQSALGILSDFLSTYKRMQVLLDVNVAGMREEDCSQKDNVSQFNQQLELAIFFALQQNFAAQAARFGHESPSLWMGLFSP